MKYYRVHSADIAWLTQQPRGIFTAIYKLVEAGTLSEEETAEYWRNREYFEKVTPEGNRIWSEMTFYRDMGAKYGLQFYVSECDEIPGEVIYEDDFQVAVKGRKDCVKIDTKPLA